MDSVIKKYFDEYRGKDMLPPIIANDLEGRLALQMPKTLYHEDMGTGYSLMGRPDEYLVLPGERRAALDHKTRASAPKKLHRAYQNQLDIYDLLLDKNDYKTAGKAFLVYYFPKTGELHHGFPFATEVKEVKTQPARAEDLFLRAVKLLQQEEPPESHAGCEFCGWHEELKKL